MTFQERVWRAQRKMIPGTFGGRSRAATPQHLNPKRVEPTTEEPAIAEGTFGETDRTGGGDIYGGTIDVTYGGITTVTSYPGVGSFTPHVITTRAVFYDPAFKDLVSGNPTNVFSELGSALYFNADERSNPGVALYQDWMKKTSPDQAQDSFSVFGWCEAKLFVDALRKAGAKATRASLLTALRGIHTVDTGGLLPSGDPAAKKPTPCFVIAHWESGTWRRWNSPAKGFDCAKPFVLA